MSPRNPSLDTALLQASFAELDVELAELESAVGSPAAPSLADTVDGSISVAQRLLVACIAADGTKAAPAATADILDVFRILVKGDPSWTAIRDNCRELVYYRNCIKLGQEAALPVAPARMAVRTARHIYLYVRTRCMRDGRLT